LATDTLSPSWDDVELALAKQTIELHGGGVQIRRQKGGRGSHISLRLRLLTANFPKKTLAVSAAARLRQAAGLLLEREPHPGANLARCRRGAWAQFHTGSLQKPALRFGGIIEKNVSGGSSPSPGASRGTADARCHRPTITLTQPSLTRFCCVPGALDPVIVHDGLAALAFLRESTVPTLALLDWIMPA